MYPKARKDSKEQAAISIKGKQQQHFITSHVVME
jgi:hypothetical protein